MSRVVYIECDGCGTRIDAGAAVVSLSATSTLGGAPAEDMHACSVACAEMVAVHLARFVWADAERKLWLGDPNHGWTEVTYAEEDDRCKFRHKEYEYRCINQAGHDPVALPHRHPARDDTAGYGCPFERIEATTKHGTLAARCTLPLGHAQAHEYDTALVYQTQVPEVAVSDEHKLPSTIPPPETHGECECGGSPHLPLCPAAPRVECEGRNNLHDNDEMYCRECA